MVRYHYLECCDSLILKASNDGHPGVPHQGISKGYPWGEREGDTGWLRKAIPVLNRKKLSSEQRMASTSKEFKVISYSSYIFKLYDNIEKKNVILLKV